MRGGTITPRPLADGTPAWVLYWRVGGRRVKKTVRGTRKDAEAALTAFLAARDRGEQRRVSTATFEVYAAAWLTAKQPRLEAATFQEYETHLRLRLIPAFGKLRLRDVTRARVEAYVAAQHARGKLSVKSINNSLIPLRQIMARAVRDGIIASNPAAALGRDDPLALPYEPPSMRYLDVSQASAYLAAAPEAYQPLAELLIATGLRIGEAVALEWSDVDFEALTLRVSRSRKLGGAVGGTKSDRSRMVHIDPGLAQTLEQQRRSSGRLGRLVFSTSTGSMLNPTNVRNRWHAQTLRDAGLPHIRLHDLRHTAATLAVAAGESVLFVQSMLGHSDVRTTMRYAHPDHEAHRAAAARVAAFRKSGATGLLRVEGLLGRQ
jgi:integrase